MQQPGVVSLSQHRGPRLSWHGSSRSSGAKQCRYFRLSWTASRDGAQYQRAVTPWHRTPVLAY